jgi:hypothetical protein
MAGPPTSTEAAITAATACRARFMVVFMLMEIMFESPDGSNVWFDGRAKTGLRGNSWHCTGVIASGGSVTSTV